MLARVLPRPRSMAATSQREQTSGSEQRADSPDARCAQRRALDTREPRDAGEEQDARHVEVQAQTEDVVRGVDRSLLTDPRQRVSSDVGREQPRGAD